MVKGSVNGTTTYYPGKHFNKEITNNIPKVQKFYIAGTMTIAVRTDGVLQWILPDHLGSTSITANADGTLNSVIQYTAFGEIRLTQGVTPTKYRYTGQLEQAELGLDYYVSRWYDPLTGHFTQADTLVPEPGKSSAYDRYAYVQNNPLRYNDPSGHDVGCAGTDASNCSSWNHVKDRSLGYEKKQSNRVYFQQIPKAPPPTLNYSPQTKYYSPQYPSMDDEKFENYLDFFDKIGIPALSITDYLDIVLEKGFKISKSGEFKIAKVGLPVGEFEAVIAILREGYYVRNRSDINIIQKSGRVLIMGIEAYGTDRASIAFGVTFGTVGAATTTVIGQPEIGGVVGYVGGSALSTIVIEDIFEQHINPWLFRTTDLGEY